MSNKKIIILAFIVFCFFAGCKSPKSVATQDNAFKRQPIEEVSENQLITDALLIDAVTQSELGNPEASIDLYKKVIQRDSSYAVAHYELANLYFLNGNISEAILESKKAIALNPKNAWYLLQLAGIYQQTFQHENACKIYQTIVEQNPDVIEYYEEWARALLIANKPEEAIKVYDMMEKRMGVTEELSTQKQRVWQSIGKPEKAIAEIEKLAKAYPNETKYNAILAEIYMSAKNYGKALTYYKKIKETSPSDKYIDISLADYYQKTKDPKKAYEYLKLGLQNPSLDEESKVQILLSFYTIRDFYGNYKEYAFDLTQMLAKMYPENQILLPVYGDFLFRDKKYEEALQAFKKVTDHDSSRYEVWEVLLFTELELGKDSLLLIDSKRASELFPVQPLPFYFHGVSLLTQKEYSKALSSFNQGIKWVVNNDNLLAEFYSSMGECHYRLKEYGKSDEFMRKALKLSPDNFVLLNNFAYYLSERDENLSEAESMSKRTIDKYPDNSTYLDTYAWILYKQKKYNEALGYMEKAVKDESNASAVVLEHYADILFKTGQTEKAKAYWKKAYEKGEGSEHLKEKAETGILK